MFGLGGNTRLSRRWGNGLVRGVRILNNGAEVTGYRSVDPNTEFLPGMVATLKSENGKVVATTHDGTAKSLAGLFYNSKTTSFYKATSEDFEAGTAPFSVTLDNPNVRDVRIVNSAGVAYDGTFTVNAANGIISVTVDGTTITTGQVGTVYYSYKDMSVAGFDQTLASGKVAIIESDCEVALEVYDTSQAYAVNAPVYVNANGLITTVAGTSPKVGFVTKPPTADNTELHIKLTINPA